MKLPRWLIVSMLTTSALAILSIAGWWWVTWPRRTAIEWLEIARTQDAEKLNFLTLGRILPSEAFAYYDDRIWTVENLGSFTRSLAETITGSQTFRLPDENGEYWFVVERGIVSHYGWRMQETASQDHPPFFLSLLATSVLAVPSAGAWCGSRGQNSDGNESLGSACKTSTRTGTARGEPILPSATTA